MRAFFSFFVIALAVMSLRAQSPSKIIMSDYMGINTNVAAYDNKFLTDLSKCVKWIREYHDWSQYEAANNFYKWDNITTEPQGYTWPDHTKFMQECRKLGISIFIDVLGKPSWAGTSPIPVNTGSGSNATDYMERLEFIGQLVARYGSKKISTSLLETADKATGLDYIKYYEDDNEPDYTWKTPLWTATNYAKYCNAVHDGYGVETSNDYPLLGIKSVDPDAMHVMAGLASADTVYVNNVLKASNGRVPFDVLNVHWYCSDHTNAYSPENEKYGYEKSYQNFFKWKNRVLPNVPVWMTEFGWDTYINSTNQHSYTYAPPLQQANYIMRSYLVLLKLGFEKAFLFMDTDSNSKNLLQYSSSGLLTDKASQYSRKISWYYMATMQNMLGKTEYVQTNSFKELSGDNEIYCLEFENPQNQDKTYALWTRKTGSKTDDGTQTTFEFDLGTKAGKVYSVLPADKDADGDTILPAITENKVALTLSETPQFLVVSGASTGLNNRSESVFQLNVFPNPATSQTQIAVTNPEKQKINISVFTLEGKLLQVVTDGIVEEGTHQFNFRKDQKPGTYLLVAKSSNYKTVRKVIKLK